VDSHHHDIIRLAWSRHLRLPDTALKAGTRHVAIDDSETSVTFVRLGDSSALLGPEWAVDSARQLSDDQLAERGALGEIAGSRAGRTEGPTVILFADDAGTTIDRHDPLISREPEHVRMLESRCAPDDVHAAALSGRHSWFTLLGDESSAESAAPVSSAAYLEWEGLLADIGALTAPSERRKGNAQVVARLATNDAFDEGMIPQWRTNMENGTARRLAARLGYEQWGVFTATTLQ
jgi:hypothetical protein